MAQLTFSQGITRHPPGFLNEVGGIISLVVPDPTDFVQFTARQGLSNYLFTEKTSVPNAWTNTGGAPFLNGVEYWLYWDINLVTGVRTFGFTTSFTLSSTAPTTPVTGDMWFNANVNKMNEFNGAIWTEVVRVFSCKLINLVPTSVSISTPLFTGTQVGLTSNIRAGALAFDSMGNPIKKGVRCDQFFTTEDKFVTGVPTGASLRVNNILIPAIAQVPLAAYQVVEYIEFNQITDASPFSAGDKVYGIIEEDVNTNEVVNFVTEGVITNPDWDTNGIGNPLSGGAVNDPVFINNSGEIQLTSVIPDQLPVGVIIDEQTILFSPGLFPQVSIAGAGAQEFLDLNDTPSSYTGQLGKFLAVSTGSPPGVEFVTHTATPTWGEIIGTLSNQTDLQTALDTKADKTIILTAGVGMTGGGNIAVDRTFDVDLAAIDHNALLNYVADEHVAHTGVDMIAGAGLSGGGTIQISRTFDIGAGTGISVNANDVALDIANDRNVAHTGVDIVAGAGLSGGGTIQISRTLTVGAGAGIVVNADDIEVSLKNSLEIAADGSPPGTQVQLVNDAPSPGNNQVYGTDGGGTKGWKADPAGGVTLKNSLEFAADGSPPGTQVQFVNDAPSPGNNQVYGTDGGGTKGWKADPAGGGGASLPTPTTECNILVATQTAGSPQYAFTEAALPGLPQPYDLAAQSFGVTPDDTKIFKFISPQDFTLPDYGHQIHADAIGPITGSPTPSIAAADETTMFTVLLNGTQIGEIGVFNDSTVASTGSPFYETVYPHVNIGGGGPNNFNDYLGSFVKVHIGDILEIRSPAPVAAVNMEDVAMSLRGIIGPAAKCGADGSPEVKSIDVAFDKSAAGSASPLDPDFYDSGDTIVMTFTGSITHAEWTVLGYMSFGDWPPGSNSPIVQINPQGTDPFGAHTDVYPGAVLDFTVPGRAGVTAFNSITQYEITSTIEAPDLTSFSGPFVYFLIRCTVFGPGGIATDTAWIGPNAS